MSRTLNVVRMQLVNRQTFIWVPLIVLGGAFVVTWGIWAVLFANGVRGEMYGGGAQAPLWYFAVVGVQALTLTFPFSQAMSVTRREFYLGTLLTAALTSAILAVIFVVGGAIETATGGWGVGGYFFALQWLWDLGPLMAGVFFFVLAMFAFVVGFWAATIYKRFGNLWLTVVLVGLAILMLFAVWLISVTSSWVQVFSFIADAGVGGLTGALALVTVAMALISFPILRRATP
ncbi:hypothetical protein [Microbacterium telephonicum]|uniref:Uncharacterized protein n=1 Tax=Microbacterium telephonicum TaxID=1714841 RepID=A0A498CIX2_9MICO|nr:hypothetical protein [Microbacterium telephonicum]RLK52251.1 hypothetical protein C7474_0183 [Microbacterium telephonicum]